MFGEDDFVDGVAMQRQRKLNEEVNDNLAVKMEEGFIRAHVLNWITVSIEKNLNQLIMINGLKSWVIPVPSKTITASSSIPTDHLCNTLDMIHEASVSPPF